MRLNSLTIVDVLGLARADITLSPVTVFAGFNAVGKSSIADAISMAFLGTPARVDKKKDLFQLLHDGAEKGRVSIDYSTDEDEFTAQFRLPKGEQSADDVDGKAFLQYVLRPHLFATLSDDDKRTMLFDLTGCKATGKVIRQKMIERGISEELVDDFAPMLKDGLNSASKEAYARATAAKAVWRSITKQTWGSVVAEDWTAPQPAGDVPTEKEMSELLALTTKRQGDLEDGIKYVAENEAALKQVQTWADRLNEHKVIADQLKRRQTKMEVTQKDLAEWEAKLPGLQETLNNVRSAANLLTCPCCDAGLRLVDGELRESGELKSNTKVVTDAALAVTNCLNSINKLKGVLTNDQRDVTQAEEAQKQVDKINAEVRPDVDIAKLDRARESVGKLRTICDELRKEFNTKQEIRNQAAGVDKATNDAASAHADVKTWLAVGDALAPDGIPNDLLADALAPVNQSVGVLAGMCGWFKAEIGADMQVRYGNRLYGLCSASEQWRADALIALAIAQISRCKIAVLDGFDIMVPKDRLALVQMSMQLTELESMDSILLLGTLKEMPKFNSTVGRVWIEGSIAENV